MIYYKILKSDYRSTGINNKFHLGLNICPDNKYTYVTNLKSIFAYLNYGTIIAVCEIPDDAVIEYSPEKMWLYGEEIPGWKTNKVIVKRFMLFKTIETIRELISQGANILIDDYILFRYSLIHNKDIWHMLCKVYPDIITEHYNIIAR